MRYYSSIAQLAALTTAVDSSATTMIASTVAGWPLTCPFTVVVDDSTLSEEIVTVTAAGVEELGRLDRVVDGVQEAVLAPLTAAQRRQFLGLLRRVLEARDGE